MSLLAALECDPAPSLANGRMMYDNPNRSATFNSTVTYTCDVGFEQSGSITRQCTVSGNWSGSTPTCIGKDFGTKSNCLLERS